MESTPKSCLRAFHFQSPLHGQPGRTVEGLRSGAARAIRGAVQWFLSPSRMVCARSSPDGNCALSAPGLLQGSTALRPRYFGKNEVSGSILGGGSQARFQVRNRRYLCGLLSGPPRGKNGGEPSSLPRMGSRVESHLPLHQHLDCIPVSGSHCWHSAHIQAVLTLDSKVL